MNTNDKLDILFNMQNQLNQYIFNSRGIDTSDKSLWIQKQTLALMSEVAEVLDEVNFKWWKNPKEIDMSKLKEELVDIVHFLISMCLTADMTSQELFDIYMKKNKENFDRQNGLSTKEGYKVEKTV